MTTLHLCGAGNAEGVRLAQRVIARSGAYSRLLLLDDDPAKHGRTVLGVPIVGPIDALGGAPTGSAAVNLVARRTASRAAVHRRIVASGVPLLTLVHPGVDADDCTLGRGVLVYEQAILSPGTTLGDGACVLVRGVVGHGATVGAGCVVAPGAVLNARVRLGERVYVGCNASVLPDVTVGDDATVGANTMVAGDVPAGASVLGVPGQVLPAPVAPAAACIGTCGCGLHAPAPGAAGLETRLLDVLRTVLARGDVGPTDNFFEAGGTSLRALQFADAVRRQLGVDLPLLQLYSLGSARRLAQHLAGAEAGDMARAGAARARLRRQRLGAWQTW